MFENINPLDRSTAFFEIAILLLISFIIGFIAAKIPISGEALNKKSKPSKKESAHAEKKEIDPRDIITEPTTIKAVLTRDRKGNAMGQVKAVETPPKNQSTPPKIAAIKKDYSKRSNAKKPI